MRSVRARRKCKDNESGMSETSLSQEYGIFENASGGYRKVPRGLFAVSGSEAVQFLNGLVTGDVSKLEDGKAVPMAFPSVQGRVVALARIMKDGQRFLIDTDLSSREKLFANLHRFTFAGDFHLDDLSDSMIHYEFFSKSRPAIEGVVFETSLGDGIFVSEDGTDSFHDCGFVPLTDELAEVLRVERGIPVLGLDADENTVVPELGIGDLISYNKGCYIGQEIIARIHFRGHVAKVMRGLIFHETGWDLNESVVGGELLSEDGKQAGRITSICNSPGMGKVIALAMVRYDYREPGTVLVTSVGRSGVVAELPLKRN